jgi:multiple sugar transport system permease protein
MRRTKRFYAAITYTLLLLGAFVVAIPFLYMVSSSLKPQTYVFETPPRLLPREVTTRNYSEAIRTDEFGLYFINSLIVALGTTGLTVLISSMLAYAFSWMKFLGKRILFAVLLLGMMIPPVMLIIPQFLVAKELKLLNSHLGLILVYVTMNLSMQTYLLSGFFRTIPKDITEAAVIDGASQLTVFRRIILPLSGPGLAVTVIFTFLYSWDEFPWAHVAIKEANRRTLPIAIALFQNQHLTEWGQVFAASLIALVPVVLVYAVFQRYFVAGIATTGIK